MAFEATSREIVEVSRFLSSRPPTAARAQCASSFVRGMTESNEDFGHAIDLVALMSDVVK
jgi:hypothetical protein